jgi:uncharacterized protein YjbI with pentapeptide repeats
VLPASTLLTASSVVILPALILKQKWVQYKKRHRKVDARELTVVHLTGACTSQGHASLRGVHLTDVHLIGIYLTGMHLTGVYLAGAYLTGVHLTGVHLSHRRTSCISQAYIL